MTEVQKQAAPSAVQKQDAPSGVPKQDAAQRYRNMKRPAKHIRVRSASLLIPCSSTGGRSGR